MAASMQVDRAAGEDEGPEEPEERPKGHIPAAIGDIHEDQRDRVVGRPDADVRKDVQPAVAGSPEAAVPPRREARGIE